MWFKDNKRSAGAGVESYRPHVHRTEDKKCRRYLYVERK
jgi:hypothetical protein